MMVSIYWIYYIHIVSSSVVGINSSNPRCGSRYRGVERHLRQKRRPKAAAKPAAKKKAAVKSSPGAKLGGSDGLDGFRVM